LEENYASKLLASLYSNPQIPRNVVQTVVNDMTSIFDNIHHTLKIRVSKLLSDGNISIECFNHFNSILDIIENPFSDLNTEYKRIKYYTQIGIYVPPQEYIVGERLIENLQHNDFTLVPVNCTQQFIPMRHVLQNFFKLKNVLTDTLEYMNKCRFYNSVLMNFTQGSVFFYNNLIIFQCFKFNTIMFDEHYHCFEVEKVINEPIFVKHNMLPSYIPNHICTMSNGKNYITVRG